MNELSRMAWSIWQAGLEAVRADALVSSQVRVEGRELIVGPRRFALDDIERLVVVGAGKAGAGMAAGLEAALGETIARDKQLTGWINVPADCVRPLRWITLHAARPAGVNEPTAEGAFGAARILELVAAAGPRDLCLCLISGGGSALLPAPVPSVSLDEKQRLTRILSGLGANIAQLNTVRKQLSRVKGGGLARASRAGQLVSLIISDVLGDPLDIIASGPTLPDSASPADALRVLEQLGARAAGVPASVFEYLERRAREEATESPAERQARRAADAEAFARVDNRVIGNNAVAVHAAARRARELGCATLAEPAERLEGAAEDVGRELARRAVSLRAAGGLRCLITGGEPTVRLAPVERRGRGGRNQQLTLAALAELERLEEAARGERHDATAVTAATCRDIAILSAGTDGEDGPTDAAGAAVDEELVERLAAHRRSNSDWSPADFLERNDAYSFFDPLDGLLRTGPTHTNVCDVRVVVTRGTG